MIQNNNAAQNSIFSSFPQYNLEREDYERQDAGRKEEEKQSYPLSNEPDIYTAENKKKPKKKIIFGSTLASAILITGIAALTLVKGFHYGSFEKLSKWADKLNHEIQEKSLKQTKNLTDTTVLYAKKGTKKIIDRLQSFSNFTAIKDYTCDKMLSKNKATSKFADKSRSVFRNVIDKTLGKKYNKVETNVKDFTSLLKHYNISNLSNLSEAQKMQKITIKGKTKTLGEWIEILSTNTKNLETAYDTGFSLGARKLRNKKRLGLLSGTSDKIKERFFTDKKLFKPKNYKKYVTEDVTSAAREELSDDILKARNKVTNNISSVHETIKSDINTFSNLISPEDRSSRDTVSNLKELLEEFKNCSGANEAESRKKVSKKINSTLQDAAEAVKQNSHYNEQEKAALTAQLERIKNSVSSNEKGALEEIMTVLKGLNSEKLISDSEFKEFSKLSSGISKGLNKAAELEAGGYFLKQAELEVGSAATDVLSILFPIVTGVYAVSKGDNKDEKISAALTTCIPLVGTFAAFIYGTTKMLSGVKNLGFSLITGAILSKLGNYCNTLYKKYKDTGSVAEVAKEEYDKFWTDITPQYEQDIKNKTLASKDT